MSLEVRDHSYIHPAMGGEFYGELHNWLFVDFLITQSRRIGCTNT